MLYTTRTPWVNRPISNKETNTLGLTVLRRGAIKSMTVKVNSVFPDLSKLNLTVIGPSGDMTALFPLGSLSGTNLVNTVFTDASDDSIVDGVAPYTGEFSAVQSLDVFNGQEMYGSWRLKMLPDLSDSAKITGTIDWSITFNY